MLRLLRYLVWTLVWFVGLSLALVVLYRFVPVPVTATMLIDGNGITKDWEPLAHIDRKAIEKAIKRNARGGRIRGGSTISQQTAKNVFLWQGGGYFRKGLEAWFTFLIENIWGKRRIMEVYLNVAETGIGTYGVEAGAQRYYNHSAAKLTPSEAARMAAALPLPKERAVLSPSGFTRRYGNTIQARIGVVRRDELDACIYG